MPLRALFNPGAYSAAHIHTAKLCFKTALPVTAAAPRRAGRRGHSTSAGALPTTLPGGATTAWEYLFGLSSSSTTTAAPAPCCPTHAHTAPAPTSFNQDSTYWRVHRPSQTYQEAVVDKFHEIEQLYRGNVEYVKRMGEQSPGLLEGLAFKGQRPPFMIVDCSDSRVNEQGIFDAEPGTMFTAGNIANMFDEADTSSNAVLTYAVGTLNVKHVVVMGHYGCGGVAASMAPLPPGYAERWLSPSSSPSPTASSPSTSSSTSTPDPGANPPPADLAVQRWIAPIRTIYETSGRTEIRAHRERIQSLIASGRMTPEQVAERLMSAPDATALGGITSTRGDEGGVEGIHLHDPAFRALVEENVKANVWRVARTRVIREHNAAYVRALSTPTPLHPVYVHGWVYDLENGVVSDLGVSEGPPGWVPPPAGVRGGFPPSLSRGRG